MIMVSGWVRVEPCIEGLMQKVAEGGVNTESLIVVGLGAAFLVGFAWYATGNSRSERRGIGKGEAQYDDPKGAAASAETAQGLASPRVSGSRADLATDGFPIEWLDSAAVALGWERAHLCTALGVEVPAVERGPLVWRLTHDESTRLLRLIDLVTLVNLMVGRSGRSEEFVAANWLGRWLQFPCPALGGKPPAAYLNSEVGFQQVERLLMQMESGAYA